MKTTQKHFELFESECEKWIDRFKLDNWEVYYAHRKDKDNRATCTTSLAGYMATLSFTKDWDDEIIPLNDKNIKISAKHEVIHLLLSRLSVNGQTRCVNSAELDEAEEELVHKLEKIIC